MNEQEISAAPPAGPVNQLTGFGLLVGFVAGVAVASAIAFAARSPAQETTSLSAITGELEVTYMYETAPMQASGSTITATRVEFHPNYVIAKDSNNRTHLWAADRLRRFMVAQPADPAD